MLSLDVALWPSRFAALPQSFRSRRGDRTRRGHREKRQGPSGAACRTPIIFPFFGVLQLQILSLGFSDKFLSYRVDVIFYKLFISTVLST
jgi:hypothetical protein